MAGIRIGMQMHDQAIQGMRGLVGIIQNQSTVQCMLDRVQANLYAVLHLLLKIIRLSKRR